MSLDHILNLLRLVLMIDAPLMILVVCWKRTPKLRPARIAAALRRPYP